MSGNTFNAPPGISWGMPHFHDDELLCLCGHSDSTHDDSLEECLAEDCRCQMFEPDYEDDQAA